MKFSRFALAASLLPGAAFADGVDAPYPLPDTVVTSGRLPESQAQATAATTVITREDIERLQARSVGELLERVPGLTLARTGGPGSLTSVFLRGTSSAQTLVLVDGQRIASASSGTSSLEFLDPAQIDRIEVVRGARSALYGSDAIGGIIQVFTRQGDGAGLKPYARFGVGSNSSYERSLGLSGGDAQTRFNLGAALDESAGIDATRDNWGGNADRDAYRNRSLSMNLSHQFSDDLKAGFTALDQRGQVETDNQYAPTRPSTDFQLSSFSAYLDNQVSDAWNSRFEIGHSEDKRDTRDDLGIDDPYQFATYRDSASWVNSLALTDAQKLLVGADWYEDRLHGSTDFTHDSRWNQALFVQHRYSGQGFSTELGMRHDKNQQFGSENTWNGALTLPLNARNDLVFSYSEGFRAPTFNDLYYPDYCYGGTCYASANPDLKPEHSKSYEVQWRNQYSDSGSLEMSLYRTDIEDAIVLDQNFIPQNIQTVRINGFEVALKQELFGWQGNLALGLLDPRDRDSGHTLQRRARRTLDLDLDRAFGPYSVGMNWRLVSSRYDDAANTEKMGGYGLLGLRGQWRLSQELALELKLDNLLDKDYSEATYSTPNGRFGYNTEGRTALFAVTWTPEL
ncbi:TonB-dependent receptor domain-containing protein [Pseudomonas citronellolis]|uniref:TonB-dependent receptor domain-containing protein n=1 Tax=Pseudomonas citronellolis TaxID=53408 RepID=UPI0023E3FEE4|nr:TonB-dependent receptor [Pseudomonas citronellolis]MDF3937026.1 TonB-dependent receptor [Pseudomonas citronellolis]